MAEPALELERLEVRYGTVAAVRDLTLRLDKGEIVGLIGPNGAGKSTTLHAIMGAVPAYSRRDPAARQLDPQALARVDRARGRRARPRGAPHLREFTVEENLRLGLAANRTRNGGLDHAYDLFPVLKEYRRRSAGVLSGGQQQQLAIGRALVAEPEVLLLDEPSLGLAPLAVDSVFEALRGIRERGVTILLVEQRALHTVALADRTHVLVGGELRLALTPKDVHDTDKIVSAYLAS